MANEFLVKQVSAAITAPIIWADDTDFNPTASDLGTAITYQLDLTSLADAAARGGSKGDLGSVRPQAFAVYCCFELNVAPTAGEAIYVYWSASNSTTAANDNTGGASGVDGAYQAGSEAEWVKQLTLIGSFIVTADADTVLQRMVINDRFSPSQRYGMPVVWNEAGQAFEGDAIEMFVALVPRTDELQ